MRGYYFVKYKLKRKNIFLGITFYVWKTCFDCVFINFSEHGIFHTDKLVAALQCMEKVKIISVTKL